MINWVIGLFVAALVAAFFGFGGVATAFADVARLLFFILLVLFVVSAVVAMFGARVPAVHTAVRTGALMTLVAAVSIGAYAWIQNDMSAERVGRVIDRQTVAFADSAGAAVLNAGDRTESFMQQTVTDIRDDARAVADPETQTSKEDAARN